MGMDYAGRNGSFHLNWSGHSYMASILDQAGADMTDWAGGNDGKHIHVKTGKAWAKLLRTVVSENRLRILSVPDTTYSGGCFHWPVVLDQPKGDVPRETREALQVISGTAPVKRATQEGISGLLFKIGGDRRPKIPDDADVAVPEKGMTDWVLEFAEFLDTCGGCRQY